MRPVETLVLEPTKIDLKPIEELLSKALKPFKLKTFDELEKHPIIEEERAAVQAGIKDLLARKGKK